MTLRRREFLHLTAAAVALPGLAPIAMASAHRCHAKWGKVIRVANINPA